MRRLWLLLVVGPLRHLLTIHHRYHLIPLVPLRRGLSLRCYDVPRTDRNFSYGAISFGAGRDMFLMSKGATHRLPL
jgi:hypothetical protein